MITIHLHNLLFHAHHGVYEGESKTGSDYEINLNVTYPERKTSHDSLDDVLNYEELYAIVKKRMQVASPLLEEVAESIIGKIKHEYSYVKEISFSIYKLQAPMEQFQGRVGITLSRTFDSL